MVMIFCLSKKELASLDLFNKHNVLITCNWQAAMGLIYAEIPVTSIARRMARA